MVIDASPRRRGGTRRQQNYEVIHIGRPSPERLCAAARLLLERTEARWGDDLRQQARKQREKEQAA